MHNYHTLSSHYWIAVIMDGQVAELILVYALKLAPVPRKNKFFTEVDRGAVGETVCIMGNIFFCVWVI